MRRRRQMRFPNSTAGLQLPPPPVIEPAKPKRYGGVVCMDPYPGPDWEAILHSAYPQVASPGDMYVNRSSNMYYICTGKFTWETCTNPEDFIQELNISALR